MGSLKIIHTLLTILFLTGSYIRAYGPDSFANALTVRMLDALSGVLPAWVPIAIDHLSTDHELHIDCDSDHLAITVNAMMWSTAATMERVLAMSKDIDQTFIGYETLATNAVSAEMATGMHSVIHQFMGILAERESEVVMATEVIRSCATTMTRASECGVKLAIYSKTLDNVLKYVRFYQVLVSIRLAQLELAMDGHLDTMAHETPRSEPTSLVGPQHANAIAISASGTKEPERAGDGGSRGNNA